MTKAPPRFSASDWPRLGDMLLAAATAAMLLAWLFALAVAWVHWTSRSTWQAGSPGSTRAHTFAPRRSRTSRSRRIGAERNTCSRPSGPVAAAVTIQR